MTSRPGKYDRQDAKKRIERFRLKAELPNYDRQAAKAIEIERERERERVRVREIKTA
jgi:hypothetical protein